MRRYHRALLVLATAAAPFTIALATPAQAALTVSSPCSVSTPTPTAVACAGYFSGNLLSNSPTNQVAQTDALASIGYSFNGNFSAIPSNDIVTMLTGGMLNFGQTLY